MRAGNFITIFCAWLASFSLGQAANQLPLSIETLADKADAVVHGKVTGMICKRDARPNLHRSSIETDRDAEG